MFKFTEYVMYFAPIGVFAAIASTIGNSGIGILRNYVKIVFSLYFALAVFILFIILLVCKVVKIPVSGLIRTLKDPALLAFSTASSEAALPKAMEQMENLVYPKILLVLLCRQDTPSTLTEAHYTCLWQCFLQHSLSV